MSTDRDAGSEYNRLIIAREVAFLGEGMQCTAFQNSEQILVE